MKKILIVVLLLLTATTYAAEWRNALAPKGEAVPLTLAIDGKPVYTVTHRADGTSAEKKAAEDLHHWLKEIVGADLARSGGPSIEIDIDDSLPIEGYRIEVKDKNLRLVGAPGRGVINAVYAFLEEDLGCRFYTNESIRLPKSPTLTVSVVPRTYAPRLRLRDPYYAFAFDPTWSLRNRTNAPSAAVPEEFGGRVDYADKFVHTFASLVPPATYFKDHPEYFFLHSDGKRNAAQLCTTDPDAIRIATQTVIDTLKKHPHTEIISVSKNDSGGDQLCQCERCKKIRSEEGGEMAVQLVLVNKVAEAIEKDYPNVSIDTLAYLDTIAVPKTIRPRKNVVIRLCNDTVGAWGHPFTPAVKNPVAEITRAWAKAHNRIYVWDYHVNFSHYLAPMPNVDVIAANIRFWINNNAEGVMLQAGYQGPAERDELKSWVSAKLLWDPSRDEKEMTQDFIWGHYGKAAPAIAEYDALLVKAGKDHEKDLASPPGGIRYPMDVSFLSKDFIDTSTAIFARAADQAKEEADTLRKVERAKLPILYVQCMRGPAFTGPENYGKIVAEFERIARANKLQYLQEGGADFEPKLDGFKKQVPTPPVSHKVISHGKEAYGYQAFPDACRLKNGDIVAVFYAGYGHVSLEADDFPNGGRLCMVRSSDEGKTWSEPQVLFDDPDDNRDPHIAQLDDGSLVCTFFSWRHTGPRYKSIKDYSGKTWRQNAVNTGTQLVRSTDNGKTWETKPHNIFPDWYVSAPVRQLPDGTCLLGLYNRQTGTVARSTDRGRTWTIPSVIPNPKKISLDAETDVIQLKDNRLYAALRSSKVHMHYATSADNGQSWTEATDIGFDGHCPHLNRLSTGEIILCHRKPATNIHISRDDTKTWQGPYEIDSCIGAYPATVELKDGSVLIVYYSEGQGSEIRAKRFRVKEDGIDFLPLE